MLSSLVLPKGASITPAWPLGIIQVPQWQAKGAHTGFSWRKKMAGNDATMTRPMQENIASKTLNFLGQRCPEDPGLCVPMYSSAPWQLLTRNNMQKAECTNSQNKPLHWTLNEGKMSERQKPAVHEQHTCDRLCRQQSHGGMIRCPDSTSAHEE